MQRRCSYYTSRTLKTNKYFLTLANFRFIFAKALFANICQINMLTTNLMASFYQYLHEITATKRIDMENLRKTCLLFLNDIRMINKIIAFIRINIFSYPT